MEYASGYSHYYLSVDTYRMSDSASLNLQKDFQSVSTRVNWRLTITSRMACEEITNNMSKMPRLLTHLWGRSLTTSAYLTVFPVQRLEGLKVVQKDPIWQVSILDLNVRKDWQWPRGICTKETQLRRKLCSRNLPYIKEYTRTTNVNNMRCRCCWPRNCWYCCSWAEISQSAVACCWPIPPGVPLAIPWFFCGGFILVGKAVNIHR